MITVRLHQGAGGHFSGFQLSGHADMAEWGHDIVCAAVSSITLTAALGLRDVLEKPGTYDAENGKMRVDIGESGDEMSDAIIETMLRGLKEIKAQYPERIQIKKCGR